MQDFVEKAILHHVRGEHVEGAGLPAQVLNVDARCPDANALLLEFMPVGFFRSGRVPSMIVSVVNRIVMLSVNRGFHALHIVSMLQKCGDVLAIGVLKDVTLCCALASSLV